MKKNKLKIAFDIDDTLWKIDRKHGTQIPDYRLIQVLEWFYKNGDEVYVWSAGGIGYAQQIVDKLGLTDMVTVIRKMDIIEGRGIEEKVIYVAFDDCETNLAKVDVRVSRDE